MNYYLFSYRLALYLTSITTFILACIVLIKGKRNKTVSLFLTFTFSIACWSFLQARVSHATSLMSAIIIGRLMYIPVIFIPCFFLHFVYLLLGTEEANKKIIISSYAGCFIFLLVIPSKMFIPSMVYREPIHYMFLPGILYHFFCAFFFTLAGLSLYKLHRGYTHSTGVKANQIKYVFWATLIAFITGGSNYLYVYNKAIPLLNPYATFGVPAYALIIAYAIFKHRLMDINLIIRKTVIYGLIYSLCLGIFSLIVILFGQWVISGSIDKRVIMLSVLAVFIVISIIKPLDKLLTSLTDRFFFRKKYEYHQTLKEASLGMIRIRKLNKLLNLIVNIISRHIRVKQTTIFLFDKEINAYVVRASRGKQKIPKNYLKITKDSSIIQYLIKTRDSIVSEELKLMQNRDEMLEKVILEMDRLNASICVPSFLKGRLLGFLLLGEKLYGDMYSQEDLSLFNTLSFQVGLAIENAQAYEELSEAKDKLFEAEKLASIGRLAGGIAHEIKNPLASIKTFTAYLDKKFEDSEFRRKFQKIVGSEVDRINHIVEQLVIYAHPKPANPKLTNLNRILEETLLLLENELQKENIRVKKNYSSSATNLFVDYGQLKQVFLNLFLNSIQAMQSNNGKLKELSIYIQRKNGCLKVKISDTGEGIPQDKIPLIFDPFFTTKEKGSGLGLSIVKSIIENHKGKIIVESELGRGTTFCINFPRCSP